MVYRGAVFIPYLVPQDQPEMVPLNVDTPADAYEQPYAPIRYHEGRCCELVVCQLLTDKVA